MSDAEEFRLLAREERMELRLVAGLATGGLQFYSQPQLGGGGGGGDPHMKRSGKLVRKFELNP